eukprot:2545907-Amphidinium_carterae.1
MAGLLLGRGLLKVNVNALLSDGSLEWFRKLEPNEVINAIFEHRWTSVKTKVLVVHVDELALLLPNFESVLSDPKRALKDFVNPLSDYNTHSGPGLKGK